MYLDQELYWKQRSKQRWLEEGDMNTKYFHVVANHRKKKNTIYLNIDNVLTHSIEDIKQHTTNYYKQILETKEIKYASLGPSFWEETHKVTPQENTTLTLSFSLNEIKTTLFACEPNGAPGPDGFSFKFY